MTAQTILTIVEGFGEEHSVPALLNRWIAAHGLVGQLRCVSPAINAKGAGRLKAPYDDARHVGVEHYVRAATRARPGAILVVLDSDDECIERSKAGRPGLANELAERARAFANGRPLGVVVADREFEAWFLSFLGYLWDAELLGVPERPEGDVAAHTYRGCKRRMDQWIGVKYEPTTHQRRLVQGLPLLGLPATAPRSYRKLMGELQRLAEVLVRGGTS